MVKMKNSGIEWIGEIPEDWKVIRNKYVMHKDKSLITKYNNEDILSLTMNGVIKRNLDAGGKMPSSFNGYQKINRGNLLLCLFDIDVTPRCVGIIQNNGITSPAYSQFILTDNNDVRFYYYYYLVTDNKKALVHLSKNLRHSLTEEQFGNLDTIRPPLDQQRAIADFLDEKCADIDKLSVHIQKEIKALQEYRKDVITKTVTKGLNDNVPMKDSGIKWIGEIPEDWQIIKGKYILKLLNRPIPPNAKIITCFRDGQVTLRENRRTDGFTISTKEIGYQGVKINDLVVHSMDGFAGAIGISDANGKASPVLNVMDSSENKNYLKYYLRNCAFIGVFQALAKGIRVRTADTRWSTLANLEYVIPPRSQQKDIADFLDNKTSQIDKIIKQKQKQLSLLADYKNSLIFEYVTGKKQVGEE